LAEVTATIDGSLRQEERDVHRRPLLDAKKILRVVVSVRWRRFQGGICKM